MYCVLININDMEIYFAINLNFFYYIAKFYYYKIIINLIKILFYLTKHYFYMLAIFLLHIFCRDFCQARME